MELRPPAQAATLRLSARILIAYLRWFPLSKGKRYVTALLKRVLPGPPAQFWATVRGGRVALLYREAIGIESLVRGNFERAELEVIIRAARPGTVAVDVGANVGVFTLPMAQAVGPSGRVLAFEPHPANILRLRRNLLLNQVHNVAVFAVALGSQHGDCLLEEAADPGYHSTVSVAGVASAGFLTVPMEPLNLVWHQLGKPEVSAMKVDVEGGELHVLEGADEMLFTCHPVLLIEAHNHEQLTRIRDLLRPLGYHCEQPDGFQPWNYSFILAAG